MWPLQLTYSPQLLAKYIQSQNINPTNKCFPIVGRINTITIYIYIFNFNIFPQCIYLYWIYSGNNYMLYLRVSLFCKTVFVTSGSQFSRGPICRGPICRSPNCRGPICQGPNLPTTHLGQWDSALDFIWNSELHWPSGDCTKCYRCNPKNLFACRII